jgi:hypothetical protein
MGTKKKGAKAAKKRRTDSGAAAILEAARPVLIKALVKCGKIPAEPPQGTTRRISLLGDPGPDYEYFRQLQDGETTWPVMRREVDNVACKLAGLAHRKGLDPTPALRSAFLMRTAPDYPLTEADVASIVDLVALVSLLSDAQSEGSFEVFDPQTSSYDAKVVAFLKKAYPRQVKFGTLRTTIEIPSEVRGERSLRRRLERLVETGMICKGDLTGYYVWKPPQ